MERPVMDGLWISDMSQIPYRPTYDIVLTVNETPGRVDDNIRHRHIWMEDGEHAQLRQLREAATWLNAPWLDGKNILVRSSNGVNRPAYVVAALFMLLGANFPEIAIENVNKGATAPLQNDTFINALLENRW